MDAKKAHLRRRCKLFVGFAKKTFDMLPGPRFTPFMPKPKPASKRPIFFYPSPESESVIATLCAKYSIKRGPFVRAAMDYVSEQLRAGSLVFVQHQFQSK